MTGHTQPLPGTLVELECDDVVRRAWVMDVGGAPDVVGLAVAATTGSQLEAPGWCAAVYPSDGAAWRCAVEVLEVDGTLLIGRLGTAVRLQRRRHVRQPVGWDAALSTLVEAGGPEPAPPVEPSAEVVPLRRDRAATPAPGADDDPRTGPARGHLRLVTTPPPRALPLPARWLPATCVDLAAGGARIVVTQCTGVAVGQAVAVRVAIPALGNPVLSARIVEVGSRRTGATTVRVAFTDQGRRIEEELAGIVVREQFAARGRQHEPHVAPALALRPGGSGRAR